MSVVPDDGRCRNCSPILLDRYEPGLIIANAENAAGGNGINEEVANELYSCGIDLLTMGNHVWDNKEIYQFIDRDERILRPANYPPDAPGKGFIVLRGEGFKAGIVNLSGRVFMPPLDCPFRMIDQILPQIRNETPVILIDFHAEATSEKNAFGWYVDGRATAVVGTHTHIQTADEKILRGGTAYITDVGMTGPRDSILGVKKELVLNKLISLRPVRFEVAAGVMQLNAVFIEIDGISGKAQRITRIQAIKDD